MLRQTSRNSVRTFDQDQPSSVTKAQEAWLLGFKTLISPLSLAQPSLIQIRNQVPLITQSPNSTQTQICLPKLLSSIIQRLPRSEPLLNAFADLWNSWGHIRTLAESAAEGARSVSDVDVEVLQIKESERGSPTHAEHTG